MSLMRFKKDKKRRKKCVVLTAYDAPTATLLEELGVDAILVGDSLGMVLLGYPQTSCVTMNEMLHHLKAVRRGAPKSFVIGDLPLQGVEKGPRQTLESAKWFVGEGGADAVKLEWSAHALESARLLTRNKIPVMGHVGLTPQQAKSKKDLKVQGKDCRKALRIVEQAEQFEHAGAFSVLLECVPSTVARAITKLLAVPTIGIGAGAGCDGQVLVFHDLVGLFKKFTPKFVKRYARLEPLMARAVQRFSRDVRQGSFPARKNEFHMTPQEELLFTDAFQKKWKNL